MKKEIVTNIDIDFYDTRYLTINAKQYDKQSRFILFSCHDNGKSVLFDSSKNYAYVRYRKPDYLGVFNECTITKEGNILVELTEQMLAVPGNCYADVFIIENPKIEIEEGEIIEDLDKILAARKGSIVSTMNFCVNVISTALQNSEIESSYEFGALNDLIDKVTKDYTFIVEQCKTHAENAKNSELAAKQSEINAKASETNAKNSEVKAKESETKAKTSETNAKTSETNAKNSEVKAKESETIASQKATESSNSAKLSQSYAVGGTSTRPNENTDNSKYYKEQANISATNAKTSETNAKTSEVNSKKSEQKAQEYKEWMEENQYVHPPTHPATMIVEDPTHRFVTDVEKVKWNDKYTKNEVDNKFSSLETNIDWKESVNTYSDIATRYPNPVDGWTVNVKDTDYTYRFNGTKWVAISANAIPKSTQTVDGLMSAVDKKKLDNISANANNYVHPSTHPATMITEDGTHKFVSDAEKTKWNDKYTKAETKSEITKEIGKIEIGGVNLATGSSSLIIGDGGNKLGKWRVSGNGEYKQISITDCPVKSVLNGIRLINTHQTEVGIAQDFCILESNETYTMSVWVKGSISGISGRIGSFWINDSDTGGKMNFTTTGKWQKIIFTSNNVPKETKEYSICYIYINGNQERNATLDICAVKIEKGNKATDWSPAPEDITPEYIGALPTTGGTITGKTTFENGFGIKNCPVDNNLKYFLGIKPFAEGGDVEYIGASEVPKAIGASPSNHTHNTIKDYGDGRTLTFAYSKEGVTSAQWFGAWVGNELRSISGASLRTNIDAAQTNHTHSSSQITGLPTKLPNPQVLKFTGAVTATYDGSGAVTVNIPTAQTSPKALTVQLNGGTTEGTNKFTFDGSVAKSINITPSSIGAAISVHSHTISQISDIANANVNSTKYIKDSNNGNNIAISYQDSAVTSATWFPVFVNKSKIGTMSASDMRKNIGAAETNHTHDVATSSSLGFTKLYDETNSSNVTDGTYHKKAINSIVSKKLDASKLANNLTTTTIGYALDARQGKALDAKIGLLNSTLGEDYIKYENGLLIQWGVTSHGNAITAGSKVTLPVPYKNINYKVILSPTRNGSIVTKFWVGDIGGNTNRTISTFEVYSSAEHGTYTRNFEWFTIGKWK